MLRGINAIESVVAIGLPCGMAAVAKKEAGDCGFHGSSSSSSTLGARGLYLSKGGTDPSHSMVRCS